MEFNWFNNISVGEKEEGVLGEGGMLKPNSNTQISLSLSLSLSLVLVSAPPPPPPSSAWFCIHTRLFRRSLVAFLRGIASGLLPLLYISFFFVLYFLVGWFAEQLIFSSVF